MTWRSSEEQRRDRAEQLEGDALGLVDVRALIGRGVEDTPTGPFYIASLDETRVAAVTIGSVFVSGRYTVEGDIALPPPRQAEPETVY